MTLQYYANKKNTAASMKIYMQNASLNEGDFLCICVNSVMHFSF